MLKPSSVNAEMIRLHLEEKLTFAEIGKMFGITRQAVHSRIKGELLRTKNGIYKKKNREMELITRLYVEEGKTLNEISKEVGLSAPGIAYRLQKFDIKIRSVKDSPTKARTRTDKL